MHKQKFLTLYLLESYGLGYTNGMLKRVKPVSFEDARDMGAAFAELAVRSKVLPFPFLRNRALHVHVVVSPVAGFFRHYSIVQEALSWLRVIVLDSAVGLEPHPESRVFVHLARYKGHPSKLVEEITESLLLELGQDKELPYHLILSLGGDGTHQEILSPLVELPKELLGKILVCRLPLGTGNDGADVADLAQAAKLLLEGSKVHTIPALRITPKGIKPFYAFNIASVGIDAFVTHMANHLKSRFNTDIYRKIADLSVLFYPFLYPPKPLSIRYRLPSGKEEQSQDRFVLAAIGVSGKRSYGNHKWILPTEENFCAITDRPLSQKMKLKNMLYKGEHITQEGVLLRKVREISIQYAEPLHLQFDGESIKLSPEHFPCKIEVISTDIQVLTSPVARI